MISTKDLSDDNSGVYEPTTRWLYNIDQPTRLVPFIQVGDLLKVSTVMLLIYKNKPKLSQPSPSESHSASHYVYIICVLLLGLD